MSILGSNATISYDEVCGTFENIAKKVTGTIETRSVNSVKHTDNIHRPPFGRINANVIE